MENIELEHIKFSFRKLETNELNPILELYRGKLYANILKSFIYNCTQNLNTKIFSVKKSYPRTITNLLSSWFFTLYSTYDFSEDSFFPNNYNNIEPLKSTLYDFIKYDKSIENHETAIDSILNNLKFDYKLTLDNLKNYKKNYYYLSKKDNFTIGVTKIDQKRGDDVILFYKFIITFPFKIRDKRQENIINNILIPEYIYKKLESRYNGPNDKLNEYIWIIVYRYQLLGSNNNQLGVLPNILNKMNTDFNLDFECFASAINSTSNNYCSIYYDVEKYFGSYGSFFNLIPLEGTFGFNPPYQKEVMDKGISKILDCLDNATLNNKNLTFIITIPIWDKLGKKIMMYKYPEKSHLPIIEYEDFNSINKIFKSKYFKAKLMIPKNKFTYLDHNFHLYKNVTIQHTYILVVSNENKNFQNVISKYNFSSNKQINIDIDV